MWHNHMKNENSLVFILLMLRCMLDKKRRNSILKHVPRKTNNSACLCLLLEIRLTAVNSSTVKLYLFILFFFFRE